MVAAAASKPACLLACDAEAGEARHSNTTELAPLLLSPLGTQRRRLRTPRRRVIIAAAVLLLIGGFVTLPRLLSVGAGSGIVFVRFNVPWRRMISGFAGAAERGRSPVEFAECAWDYDDNCTASKCCRGYGMQCYEKDSVWASCKAGCTPGVDPYDVDTMPWTCRPLGERMSKPPGQETCNRTRFGADFWSGKVMQEAEPASVDECAKLCEGSTWCGLWAFQERTGKCLVVPRTMEGAFVTPEEVAWDLSRTCRLASGDLPVERCAAMGEDCSRSRCCASPGEQCYVKDEATAQCRPSCESSDEADGWKCWKLGPRICRQCHPRTRQRPAVVIPTFERDLCKALLLMKSITAKDPKGFLGDVYVLWVSKQHWWNFKGAIDQMKQTITADGKRDFKLLDFSGQLQKPKCLVWSKDGSECIQYLEGWHAQMMFKLKIASMVSEDFYVVLDSKNALLSEVTEDTFFSECHTAKIWGNHRYSEIPSPHKEWYSSSARLLNVTEVPDIYWPTSITPAVMHRGSVLELLQHLGEGVDPNQVCDGPICMWVGLQQATEFTLYYQFVASRGKLHCTHSVELSSLSDSGPPRGQRRIVTLWRGHTARMNYENCHEVQSNNASLPLMFGVQSGLFQALEADKNGKRWRRNISDCVSAVYDRAGLTLPDLVRTVEELDQCSVFA